MSDFSVQPFNLGSQMTQYLPQTQVLIKMLPDVQFNYSEGKRKAVEVKGEGKRKDIHSLMTLALVKLLD